MSQRNKTYFISDVHLGAPSLNDNQKREFLFADWLDFIEKDVKSLYLLGDIFDFWYEYKSVVPRGYTRILGRLAILADKGIPIHFFTGNHDIWVYDYLPNEIGLTLHRKELITEIGGKKFFLSHGDDHDSSDRGYHLLKKAFTNKQLQWLFSRLHPNFAFKVAQTWSKKSRLSNGNLDNSYDVKKDGMYIFAKNLLDTVDIDYFIMGHRHQLIYEPIGNNSQFIILGDWIKYFSYGVFDDNKFELKTYSK